MITFNYFYFFNVANRKFTIICVVCILFPLNGSGLKKFHIYINKSECMRIPLIRPGFFSFAL